MVMHDEICYLLMVAFGGMKFMFNNRRVAAHLMAIGVKVFEHEVKMALAYDPKKTEGNRVQYGFENLI